MADLPVRLQTEGASYAGWENVTIQQSLEQASNTFSLRVSDTKADALSEHPIKKGERCRVLVGDQPVINGYIGKRTPSFDAKTHAVSFSGRDITCDIVDSSAILPNQELHNVTLDIAAKALCEPLGVQVDCPAPGEAFDKFVVNDGETIFQCLEQHAKQRGLMIYTLGDGVLQINRPSPIDAGISLIEGENILRGSAVDDEDDCYHHYISKSQSSGKHRAKAEAFDPNIRKGRTLIIRAEKANAAGDNQNRAEYEMHLRQAKGDRAKIVVQGWTYKNAEGKDKVWQPNLLINLLSPRLDKNGQYLVSSVSLSVDDKSGTIATLDLVNPAVYALA